MVTVKHAVNSALKKRSDGNIGRQQMEVVADLDDPTTSVVVVVSENSDDRYSDDRYSDDRYSDDRYSDSLNSSSLNSSSSSPSQMSVTIMLNIISSTATNLLRDYRSITHPGSLRSTTASALLVKSGFHLLADAVWEEGLEGVFVDPMCGSGTVLLEAVRLEIGGSWMEGRVRDIGWVPCFGKWVEGEEVWNEVMKGLGRDREGFRIRYVGGDLVGNNVRIMKEAIENAGFQEAGVRGFKGPVEDMVLKERNEGDEVICLTNPPWGGKILKSNGRDIEEAWDGLGVFAKRELKGGEIWIISPKTEMSGRVRMKDSRRVGWKQGDGKVWCRQYLVRGGEKESP
ncbi:hypothetical protein TrCOL_g11403 [Triparma columacea]|uniref:Ribosomal RNA large subunit methyltransferase K/L-like methyltransferase domain-containing protein n=1 Tax=Triparma columacea TaxID=722753 RepID=A0A9W7L2M1_9STRA|nr:hypothetical protein TrCOL_g11403 [Triparma columacea]